MTEPVRIPLSREHSIELKGYSNGAPQVEAGDTVSVFCRDHRCPAGNLSLSVAETLRLGMLADALFDLTKVKTELWLCATCDGKGWYDDGGVELDCGACGRTGVQVAA